ncbi:MAG: hypothetical protein Q9167_005021 [Letrouitia subvulpina]
MDLISVPANGLSLKGPTISPTDNGRCNNVNGQPQAMRLDLAEGVLESITRAFKTAGKEVHLSFGNNSHQLLSIPQPTRSELYACSPENDNDLRVIGVMSHKLAMKKAQDQIAGADAALAALQSKMASHQKDKDSKKIKVVKDTATLPPPIQQKKTVLAKSKPNALSALQDKRNALNSYSKKPMTQSMPTSPALGANRSQTSNLGPTSAPAFQDPKTRKMQALREALVHLLAVRPVSEKFIAQKIACAEQECRDVLNKVGKRARLDPMKWDLSDRAFKELDPWKFNYERQEDRVLAVDRAVSAFDRMRLSTQDKVWQLLLPKADRGKNKVLSKLNLHSGPLQANTPKIHVQSTDDLVKGNLANDSDRKDRLAPSDAEPMVRSKSNDQIRKKRVSDREAQAKRLLSKNPKKALNSVKPKGTAKKGAKKASANPNIKSTEFVHDSDEDASMEDAVVPAAPPAQGNAKQNINMTRDKAESSMTEIQAPQDETCDTKVEAQDGMQAVKSTLSNQPATNSSHFGSHGRSSDTSPGSSGRPKTISRQRTTSSSIKPSPLGSSPPTNASDFDNDHMISHASTSSNSSTPLLAQSSRLPATSKAISSAAPVQPESSQNSSKHNLKRKADDLDSSIHKDAIPLTNGHMSPNKRSKTSVLSPPATDGSDSSTALENHRFTLERAQRFKKYYMKYERLHRELCMMSEPPADKVEQVKAMHKRLIELKNQISRAVA